MRDEIQAAIDAYESGDKGKCLELVRLLINSFSVQQKYVAELQVRQVDSRSRKPTTVSSQHTLYHWLDLARHRLVKEVEDPDEIALIPVMSCLVTALDNADA